MNNLKAASVYKLKLYSINMRGKSKEIWLKAQTLRPAERLVDNDLNGSNKNLSLLNDTKAFLLRGKSMVIIMLISASIVITLVTGLAIVTVCRVRRSRGSAGSSTSTLHGSSNHPDAFEPQAQQQQQQQKRDPTQSNAHGSSTMFNEDDECCCDEDDCCDEMLLTSANVQQSCINSSKGPPDIIPSFGYSAATGLDNKQFLSFGLTLSLLNYSQQHFSLTSFLPSFRLLIRNPTTTTTVE